MKPKLLIPVIILLTTAAHAQNVGIGTQIPSYTLTVKDSSGSGSGQGIAQISPDGLVAVGTYVDNASAYIQTHTNHDLNFSTANGAPKITLQKTTGNVGIGTVTPTARLDVRGHGRSGILGITDSVAGSGFSYNQYNNAPAGIRGEYRATGLNQGSGVVGTALSTTPGYGNGITGKGGFTGVYGLGSNGGLAGIYAAADSATWGLYVDGNSNFIGNTTSSGNVIIGGTIKIQGGTPGSGKILTSDANGLAIWQIPSAATIPAAISSSGFVGIIDETQTSLTVASGGATQTLPFIEYPSVGYTFDDGSNLNGSYTVPSTGFYHFEVTLNLLPPTTASQDGSISVYLYKNGVNMAPMSVTGVYSGEAVPTVINGGSINIKLQAGDIISVRFGQSSGQPVTIFNSALNGPATRFSGYRIY
jgi:hypothetical protein